MRVRRAAEGEAAAVADLYLRARRAAVPAIPPSVHDDEDVHRHFATVVLPQHEVWLLDADGGLVALLVLHDDWVDHLYVDPARTGRGLGSRLLDHAKAQRPGGLQLWAFQSNSGARRFYEHHGFEPAEMTDGDNEEGAPDVRYVWAPQS